MAQSKRSFQHGERLGVWIVVEEVERRVVGGRERRMIRVRCPSCGTTKVSMLQSLLRGMTCRSCHENSKRLKLCHGDRFGMLAVLDSVARDEDGTTGTRVRCDCGRVLVIPSWRLADGQKSCGCNHYPRGQQSPNWSGHKGISGLFLAQIRASAAKREILFDLTIEQLWELFESQGGRCALSGVALNLAARRGQTHTASLDRIDSSRGYTLDNVQWVHKTINLMKQSFTQDEFIEMCRAVERHQKSIAKRKAEPPKQVPMWAPKNPA